MSEGTSCRTCGATMRATARFCPQCGAATRAHEVARRRAHQEEQTRDRQQLVAVAVVFGGVLLSLTAGYLADPVDGGLPSRLVASAGFLLSGLMAIGLLGPGAGRASLAGPSRPTATLLGALTGVGTFAVAWAYVAGMSALLGPVEEVPAISLTQQILLGVVLAPLLEEWLCRGILFQALRPFTTERLTIVCTAVLFAFLHFLNGGDLLELPHRFVAGLVYGWWRARSGSLLPGIAGHALHNLLAVLL